LNEGRISLRVMTEVSELSNDNAITLSQSGSSLTVPSIKVRRAETTLEIPSGGAMAMAGLIQEQTKQAINGLPGLSQLPVLGTLFRSRDFVNRNTELMVLVTPFIVRAVAQKDLSRPDDGFADASDPQSELLGTINRIYGVPGRIEPARNYRGTYGFITDWDARSTPQRTPGPSADRKRALRLAGALIGLAVALGACKHTGDEVAAVSIPDDYRLRHPIAGQAADRSSIAFVG